MPDIDHPLERRAHLLAGRLSARKEMLVQAVAPPGTRPLFTEQMSKPQALAWWQKHRFDDLGKKVVGQMKPEDILELDQALSQANEAAMFGGADYGTVRETFGGY